MVFGLFKKKSKSTDKSQLPTDERYLTLKVKEVVKMTEEAVNVIFENPEGGLAYLPGQFLTLIFTIEGKKIRRAYSLCTTPGVDEHPGVTVKRVKGGVMSNYINSHLKADDEVEVMAPMGMFTLDYQIDQERHIILLGGGSGITPLNSILKAVLAREPKSIVSLVYANNNEKSIIFYDELEKLAAKHPNRFKLTHVLNEAPEDWKGYSGLLNNDKLKKILTELPQHSLEKTEYYTCGPEPLMDIVFDTLNELGVPPENKNKESFVAGSNATSEEESTTSAEGAALAKITIDGEVHEFEVPAGKTVLEAGLDADVDMPYSCQSGLCTACRGKCVSGKLTTEDADGLSQKELEEGYVLTCIGKALTSKIEIEIG